MLFIYFYIQCRVILIVERYDRRFLGSRLGATIPNDFCSGHVGLRSPVWYEFFDPFCICLRYSLCNPHRFIMVCCSALLMRKINLTLSLSLSEESFVSSVRFSRPCFLTTRSVSPSFLCSYRSPAGNSLIVSSLDGYCTFISFDIQDIGDHLSPEGLTFLRFSLSLHDFRNLQDPRRM